MAEAYYEPTPATDGATMNPVPGAVFEVFEIADTTFSTPLSLRVGSGNPTTTVTASDTLATLPGVYVTSPNFEHIWKSGTFEWRRDSIDGAKKAIEDAKLAASNSAAAADASAASSKKSADLVGAPADTAIETAIKGAGTLTGAALMRAVVPVGLVGGQDCTTAIQNAATKAQNEGVPLLFPRIANGLPIKMSATLQAWSGARIIGQGAVIDFLTDGTATGRGLFLGSATGGGGVSDVQIHGLKIICSNAVSRRGVYGLISVFDSTDVLIEDCWIGNATAKSGGESVGIWTMNTTDLRIVRPRVHNTLADGIHLSRATQRAVIDHPVVIGAQDDAVAVVSKRQDGTGPIYEPCKYVQIIQPVVRDSTVLGAGVALVGAQDCTVIGGSIDGTPDSIVVIAQADYGGIIDPARNTVIGVTGTNSAKAAGSFRVANATHTTISGCEMSGNVGGYSIIASPRTKISGGGVASTGGDFGVYADGASTRVLVSGLDLSLNGATGYKVYRGTAAGGTKTLIATLGRVATFTDTGAAGAAATVPTTNTATVSAPAVTLGTTASSGGTFTAGTYYWVVTAITSKGETVASNEVSATLVANGTQVLNWGAIINAILLQGANSLDTGNIKS